MYQRWSTGAPIRGVLEMWLEYGSPSWHLLSSVPRCSPCSAGNTWAWKVPAGGAMPNCPRREPHFSPPICHISPPTDPICVIFYINSLHSNKEYHCNKNGAKQSSSWPGTPFRTISLGNNQQKECQKKWKTKFHQIRFSACQTIPDHKRSTPVVRWKEALGRVWWLHTLTFSAKVWTGFLPRLLGWGSPFDLNLHETSNYVI